MELEYHIKLPSGAMPLGSFVICRCTYTIVSGDINGYRLLSDNSKYECSSIQFSEANVGDYVEIAHTIDNIVVELKVLKNRILRK